MTVSWRIQCGRISHHAMEGKEALFAGRSRELCQGQGLGTTTGHHALSQLCRGPCPVGIHSLLGGSSPGPCERLLMLGGQPGHAVSSLPTSQMRAGGMGGGQEAG